MQFVRRDHVAGIIVNVNLSRLCRRIENADVTRTRGEQYESTAATSTANRNVGKTSGARDARSQKAARTTGAAIKAAGAASSIWSSQRNSWMNWRRCHDRLSGAPKNTPARESHPPSNPNPTIANRPTAFGRVWIWAAKCAYDATIFWTRIALANSPGREGCRGIPGESEVPVLLRFRKLNARVFRPACRDLEADANS